MTATSPITTLAELARDRSSSKHDYDPRIEPRSMVTDYSLNGRHPYGDEGNNNNNNNNSTNTNNNNNSTNTNNSTSNNNNYAPEGHYNREETNGDLHHSENYHPSSAQHYPHSGTYLPPPIQTLPFGGVHPHSFASPTSPSLSTTPISPMGHFHSSDHYEYDPQGTYHAPSYHAYHASYPQEHHHPLSPTEEGHHFYGSHPIPAGKDDGHNNTTKNNHASNGSYSSSSSSGHYSRHPFDPNNHHGSNGDHPESPNMGPMGHDTMVHSEGHRNGSVSYPASPLSPGVMSKSKRRSEVFAAHESPYFFPATQHFNLFSLNQSMRYDLQVAAKIDRGFFLAANDWTCYRRNYFQISASFSIAGLDPSVQSEVPCLLERDDELLQVHRFMVCIGAHIQHGEKVIELVQHTPKRDKGPQITPRPTPIRAGGDVNSNASASNSNVITFERVQFKTATANNGKRRAAQQYYQVHVDLYAELDGGERVVVATAFSAPLVVRGRSPGHYADNEEAMSPQEYEGRNHPRNDSIASNGSVGSPPPSMYRYPNSYNSSYQYQSLGTASHMASQYHENGYYGHHDQEYPGSPLSPIGPPHLGGMETPQGHYDSHYTPGSQGFSPESVSPDMYSPSGFPGSGPESPMSNLHQLAYMHDHSQTHPYDSYESHQDGYREHDQHHDEDDHETQMAGLRIHSPVSPVSSAAPTPRRQSFSSSLSKKGDRSSIGSMTRKTRSSSVSGISKRAPSKTRSTRNVSASSAKDFSKGLGISNDHIAESPMEELP